MNIDQIRNYFPHTKEKIYFNHAAIGPISTLVSKRIQEFIHERSRTQIENYGTFRFVANSAKKRIAQLLKVNKNRIAWVDNVSNGLNILAQGLDWKTGDRIILNDQEFPSNIYPFINLASKGVEIDFAKSKNWVVDVEDYEKLITPKTKLISISSVQFLSGHRADLKALGELCKAKGIIFCVDAIQSAGVVEMDAVKYNIDFLAGGTQKWLMGLQGLSYIYISEELQSKINQAYAGWLSVDDDWNLLDYNLEFKETASRFQSGTFSAIGVAAIDASLEMFASVGYDEIEKAVIKNSMHFFNKLKEAGIETLLKNADAKKIAGIVSVTVADSDKVIEYLEKQKIHAAVREGILRFSPHFYNTKDEIDEVVKALKEFKK